MPELPEVEVCRLGIQPHIIAQQVSAVVIRTPKLRWPIPDEIKKLVGETVCAVERRSKYLLVKFKSGTLLLHLGMSGTIRILDNNVALVKHDHFDLVFAHGKVLRLNDPRRFGAVLWFADNIDQQGLLNKLGPEPLGDDFIHGYLFNKAKSRKVSVKSFLMNNHIVVGVGNIYANEALFKAGILPTTIVSKITQKRFDKLTDIIKEVLVAAITQGGTTLKDFTQTDGKPGYFAQQLMVYGRAGEQCLVCKTALKELRQTGRSSVFCPSCQK
jgi:formamidopyrimidine-DNA glycosylase